MSCSSLDVLLSDLRRNDGASHVKLILVRQHIVHAGIDRDQLLANLLRAGALSIEEAVLLLDGEPPTPPPSPPSASSLEVEVVAPKDVKRQNVTKRWLTPFFAEPSAEHIKTYLDTIMLLTTLMFGFGAGFLFSFGRDELDAADSRWLGWCTNTTVRALPGLEGWCEGVDVHWQGTDDLPFPPSWLERPSFVLGHRAVWTYVLLAMSLSLAVLEYLCMLSFRLDIAPDSVRQRWWLFFQWPCHVAMGLCVCQRSNVRPSSLQMLSQPCAPSCPPACPPSSLQPCSWSCHRWC